MKTSFASTVLPGVLRRNSLTLAAKTISANQLAKLLPPSSKGRMELYGLKRRCVNHLLAQGAARVCCVHGGMLLVELPNNRRVHHPRGVRG
jgi:hypothetical protein